MASAWAILARVCMAAAFMFAVLYDVLGIIVWVEKGYEAARPILRDSWDNWLEGFVWLVVADYFRRQEARKPSPTPGAAE